MFFSPRFWFNLVSFFLFVLVVASVLLFAEGYGYDLKARDFVKRGVVYFEGFLPAEAKGAFFVDGKVTELSFPGELRITPGSHVVVFRSPGFHPWEKHIAVPEDTIVRFGVVRLLKEGASGPVEFLRLQAIQSLAGREAVVLPEGLFLKHSSMHFIEFFPNAAPDRFWLRDFPGVLPEKIFPLNPDRYLVVTRERELAFMDLETKSFQILAQNVLDVAPLGAKFFVLSAQGILEWESGSLREESELLPLVTGEKAASFSSVSSNGKFLLFVFQSNGLKHAAVFSPDGALKWQVRGISAAALEGTTVRYAAENEFFIFDLREGRFAERRKTPFAFEWFSRIGDSFQMLLVTREKELKVCDEDFGNCHGLATVGRSDILSSEDRNIFLAVVENDVTMFDMREEPPFPLNWLYRE